MPWKRSDIKLVKSMQTPDNPNVKESTRIRYSRPIKRNPDEPIKAKRNRYKSASDGKLPDKHPPTLPQPTVSLKDLPYMAMLRLTRVEEQYVKRAASKANMAMRQWVRMAACQKAFDVVVLGKPNLNREDMLSRRTEESINLNQDLPEIPYDE